MDVHRCQHLQDQMVREIGKADFSVRRGFWNAGVPGSAAAEAGSSGLGPGRGTAGSVSCLGGIAYDVKESGRPSISTQNPTIQSFDSSHGVSCGVLQGDILTNECCTCLIIPIWSASRKDWSTTPSNRDSSKQEAWINKQRS